MKKYVVYYCGLKKLGMEQLPDVIPAGMEEQIAEEIEDTRLLLAENHGIPEKRVKTKIVKK